MRCLLVVCPVLLAAGAAGAFQALSFTQAVDHFNAQCLRTFEQRYYVDDSNWQPGGPLLHLLGGESPIGPAQLPGLYPFASRVLARDLRAMVLVTEHRYFGESLPFGPNGSFSLRAEGCSGGLGLLNVEQALRDFVAVAASVREARCPGCQVVALGGSYPGLLAAMIRVRYPDEVQAAVAASAPLGYLAGQVDPYGWFRVATEAAAAARPECPQAVRRMFSAVQLADAAALVRDLGLCDEGLPVEEFRREAAALLRTELATLAMTNYPPRTSPLAAACTRVVAAVASAGGGLRAAKALLGGSSSSNSSGSSPSPTQCRSLRAEWPAGRAASIDCIDRTGCGGGIAGEAWDYMGCTWLRIPIATNNVTDMFPPTPWSEDRVKAYCTRRFDATPRPELLPVRFGFLQPEYLARVASRIIFTNGLRDGWSAGGVLRSLGEELPALVLRNGAHHSEMGLPTEDDTEDVVAARRSIEGHLRRWLLPAQGEQLLGATAVLYGVPPAALALAAAAPARAPEPPSAASWELCGCLAVVLASLAAAAAVQRSCGSAGRTRAFDRAPLLQTEVA